MSNITATGVSPTFTDRERQVIKIALQVLLRLKMDQIQETDIRPINEFDILAAGHVVMHCAVMLAKLTGHPIEHFQNRHPSQSGAREIPPSGYVSGEQSQGGTGTGQLDPQTSTLEVAPLQFDLSELRDLLQLPSTDNDREVILTRVRELMETEREWRVVVGNLDRVAMQKEQQQQQQHHPLDHDKDGKPGGSLKGEESTVKQGQRNKDKQKL